VLEIIELGFTDPAFEKCFAIRWEVFVVEQNVPPAEEADDYDAGARHFLALYENNPAGTARVIFKAPGIAKITRVAVKKPFRGLRIGAALMRYIETHVDALAFIMDAQTHALRFYEALGYQAYGDEFVEAGIAHRHMTKTPAHRVASSRKHS
jgi:predicted GNAT family N-acyltransferase